MKFHYRTEYKYLHVNVYVSPAAEWREDIPWICFEYDDSWKVKTFSRFSGYWEMNTIINYCLLREPIYPDIKYLVIRKFIYGS